MHSNLCLLLVFGAFAVPASANPPQAPAAFDNPAYVTPESEWKSLEDANGVCRDQLRHAASEEAAETQSTAKEQDDTTSPYDAEMIYAVDIREEGCSLMLVKDGDGTVRRLPDLEDAEPRKIPASQD